MKQVYLSDVSLNLLGRGIAKHFHIHTGTCELYRNLVPWWLVSLLGHYGQLSKSHLQGVSKLHDMVSAMVASIPHVYLGLDLALNIHLSVRRMSHILKEG